MVSGLSEAQLSYLLVVCPRASNLTSLKLTLYSLRNRNIMFLEEMSEGEVEPFNKMMLSAWHVGRT